MWITHKYLENHFTFKRCFSVCKHKLLVASEGGYFELRRR